jgi:MFS family permease
MRTPRDWPGAHELVRLVNAIEAQPALDQAARLLSPPADWLVGRTYRRELLQGAWIGHAAHPFLTDIPIGSWTSASILDLVGGRPARPGAEILVGVGVASAIPTVLTGLAEWAETTGSARRVGVVHAGANLVAIGLYGASWAARRRDRQGRGALLALAGMTTATVGGYLGGHLISVLNVSTGGSGPVHDRSAPVEATRAAPVQAPVGKVR